MQSKPGPNGKPDMIKSVESTSTARRLSATLKTINHMISWWTINRGDISADPDVVAKCGKIILQLENYRNDMHDKFVEFKRLMVRAIESYEHGPESDEFRNAEGQVNELHRELERMFDDAGHYFQALVTRWFYEDDLFTITDVEVRSDGYDFDIEIADERGSRYCVEVWQGQSKRHHATRENTSIIGVYRGVVHSDPGSVPDRLTDVASDLGGVSVDSKHDLPKVWSKLEQLPDYQMGFLVACRQGGNFPPELWQTDFPIVPLEHMPNNKCIIVLNFGSDGTSGKRGTAFVVHNPDFEPVEVAKKIIRSLEFKYNQEIYVEKIRLFKQFNLR